MKKRSSQAGITLIEVIVGISIIAIAVVAIGLTVNAYVDARNALLVDAKAIYLAEEGYEIARAIRDDNWNTIDALSTDTYHYLAVSTTTIGISGSPEVIDTDYIRSFMLRALYRNSNNDIVESTAPGATLDAEGREIEVFVASPNGTSSFTGILTNIFVQ